MSRIAACAALLAVLFAGLAKAQQVSDTNGFNAQPFILAADPGFTTVTFSDATGNNATVVDFNTPVSFPVAPATNGAKLDERDYSATGSGFEANRHDFRLSTDGGTTAALFDLSMDSFDISMDVTLEAGSNSPRKEAGFILQSPMGNGQFIVNSDAGEIVSFGNPLNFFSFGAAPNNLSYTSGDTINMRLKYTAPERDLGGTVTTAGSQEFIVNLNGAGAVSSGPLEITNLEQSMFADTQIIAYYQGAGDSTNSSDFATATFNNFLFEAPASVDSADFEPDSDVDGHDFLIWQSGFGIGTTRAQGDANGSETVDGVDLAIWESQYGDGINSVASVAAIPEPSTWLLIGLGLAGLAAGRNRQF